MSQYVSVGITDEDLIFKGEAPESGASPASLMNDLFDFIARSGIEIENAANSPQVREFMAKTGIKVAQLEAEKKRRQQKKNAMMWGGAALVVGILVMRSRK